VEKEEKAGNGSWGAGTRSRVLDSAAGRELSRERAPRGFYREEREGFKSRLTLL
jgi:hypothetical protein